MKNGTKNGGKPARKRGPDGRFLSGDPGGPGRKKLSPLEKAYNKIEKLIDSADEKTALKAAIQRLRIEVEKPKEALACLTPATAAVIRFHTTTLQHLCLVRGISELEMLDRMGKVCARCTNLELGEITDPETMKILNKLQFDEKSEPHAFRKDEDAEPNNGKMAKTL